MYPGQMFTPQHVTTGLLYKHYTINPITLAADTKRTSLLFLEIRWFLMSQSVLSSWSSWENEHVQTFGCVYDCTEQHVLSMKSQSCHYFLFIYWVFTRWSSKHSSVCFLCCLCDELFCDYNAVICCFSTRLACISQHTFQQLSEKGSKCVALMGPVCGWKENQR